jgi:hypothetical protein
LECCATTQQQPNLSTTTALLGLVFKVSQKVN